MNYVFLILVFGTAGSTVNTTTPMPSMEVCKSMVNYHMNVLPRQADWSVSGISKPFDAICTEVSEPKK